MPLVGSIVEFINQSLKASSLKDKRFQPGQYNGVSTLLARKKGNNSLEILPAFMNANGDYRMLDDIDKHNIIIYHKVISNAYSFDRQNSYGDGYSYKCQTEMAMIVISNIKKIHLSSEMLEPMIIFGIPQQLSPELKTQTKFSSCLITPTSSILDKINVFRQEYPQAEYFFKPEHQIFSIRYRIETVFDKNCVDKCLCGD